jgi:hypothetical protein
MSLSLQQKSLASEYKPRLLTQTQRIHPHTQRIHFRE